MGRIVGQIAKWPREPQNLSRDSGHLRHARCALRGEAGDYVIPSNPYGEISGSSRAWGEFSGAASEIARRFQGAGAAAIGAGASLIQRRSLRLVSRTAAAASAAAREGSRNTSRSKLLPAIAIFALAAYAILSRAPRCVTWRD